MELSNEKEKKELTSVILKSSVAYIRNCVNDGWRINDMLLRHDAGNLINYKQRLKKIKDTANWWRGRGLTLHGRTHISTLSSSQS